MVTRVLHHDIHHQVPFQPFWVSKVVAEHIAQNIIVWQTKQLLPLIWHPIWQRGRVAEVQPPIVRGQLHWHARGSRLEDDHSSMPGDHVSRTITTHSPGPF